MKTDREEIVRAAGAGNRGNESGCRRLCESLSKWELRLIESDSRLGRRQC